ncbi:hypothetical protein Tco_0754067 [Tanacetum coccineum]
MWEKARTEGAKKHASVAPLPTDYEIVFAHFPSTWSVLLAVRDVGMPISAGMTASVPYVSENGVSHIGYES